MSLNELLKDFIKIVVWKMQEHIVVAVLLKEILMFASVVEEPDFFGPEWNNIKLEDAWF